MTISYGWKNLHSAVACLTSSIDLKDRFCLAFTHSLVQITPENDLPEDLVERFKALMDDMTGEMPRQGEGRIQARVGMLTEWEIGERVDEIISLYDSVCRYRGMTEGKY